MLPLLTMPMKIYSSKYLLYIVLNICKILVNKYKRTFTYLFSVIVPVRVVFRKTVVGD